MPIDKMFDVFNKSYASLSSFVAITDIQKNISRKNTSINQSEYIKFVEDKDHNIVAFSIVMPSFPKLYKKTKESYSLDLYIYLKLKTK
jgi:hypothetical protein